MSRRMRQEAEKLRQLNEELQDEEDKIKQQKEKIYGALVWRRLASGIRIQDLKPKYHDDVLKLVQEHYMPFEVLCRNSCLKDDPASLESFLNKLLITLKDTTSIIALNETKEDEIAGFLVLKVYNKVDFGRVFSRVQLVNGEAHKKVVTFTSYLGRKADVFKELECETFMRYYLLCVLPEYRKKGLGFQLMLAAMDVARSLNVPVIMGLFSCFALQKLAKRLGMKVVHEINYVNWRDRFNEMIFDDPGVGNYTCAIMAGHVPPPPPPDPSALKKQEEEKETVKLTREEKRKLKMKNKK